MVLSFIVQRPQNFKVLVRPEGAEHEVEKVDGVLERL